MHNRMKEALVLLGRLLAAYVRPPLLKLPANDIERVRQALVGGWSLARSKRARLGFGFRTALIRPLSEGG